MAIVGPWAIAVYEDKVNWGAVPGADQGRPGCRGDVTFTDAKNIGMYSACENQGTAWDVLKFATNKDQDGKLLEKTGQMPMRADLPTAYPDYFTANPDYKPFADQASRTVEVPNVPNSVEIWQTFRDAYSKSVIFGKKPIDEVFRRGHQDQRARRSVLMIATSDGHRAATAADAGRPAAGSSGRQPLGILLRGAVRDVPGGVFAYPLGFAVWISFHDYFFAAPGAQVDRPFVGLDNYSDVLSDPALQQSFLNVAEFLVINVPLTVVLSLVLATALNCGHPVPHLLPGVLLHALRDGERRAGRGVAVPVLQGRAGQPVLGPLAPDPSWLVNACWRCR